MSFCYTVANGELEWNRDSITNAKPDGYEDIDWNWNTFQYGDTKPYTDSNDDIEWNWYPFKHGDTDPYTQLYRDWDRNIELQWYAKSDPYEHTMRMSFWIQLQYSERVV
jgi:hypothetical protein